MTHDFDLLARLERYYDEAPRANADSEEHGPFTIFLSRGGWPYYARPRLGLTDEITADQVTSVARKPLSIAFEEISADKIVPVTPPASGEAEAPAAE